MNRLFKGIISVAAIVCAIMMLKNGLSEMSFPKTWDFKKSINKNDRNENNPAGGSADEEMSDGESLDERSIAEKSLDEDTKQKYIALLNEGKEDDNSSYQLAQSGEYNGERQYRFQYMIDDKPVYGKSAVIVSDKKGNVIDIINSYENENITKTEEKNIAEGQADNEAEQYMMKELNCTKDSIDRSKAEEMYYVDGEKAVPVYQYNIAGQTKNHELYGKEILVSAVDGNILSERSTICYVRENGTYSGQLKSQNIAYERTNDNCRMEDKQDEIIVFQPNDRRGAFWYREDEHHVEAWRQNSHPDASAVDAMANLEKVVDFYENMVDFQSLTGSVKVNLNGSAINTYVNVENLGIDNEVNNYADNAFFWETPFGESILAFTARTNENAQYSADLDVVGHEFGHSVFTRKVHPTGRADSGVLNEAYADILGLCAESYSENRKIDWVMSDFRRMEQSTVTNYAQINGQTEVHEGSKLITYVAYLMSKGYKTKDFTKEESRIQDVKQVTNLWISSMYRLPEDCSFKDCRLAVEKAAKQLCSEGQITESQKKCVSLAFDDVGIPGGIDDDTQAEHIKTIDETFRDYLEEKLIPKYGVMPVKELSVKREDINYSDYEAWPDAEELRGILAAEIYDYDNDGRREMLLIRATCDSIEGKELSGSLDMGGGTKLYMEMFEWTGQVKMADSREFTPCGKYRVTYHQIQTGFFTYADKGTVYIGVDSNFRMNETITTLALYQYKDNEFQYVKGICRQRQGSGYEAVLTADEEPKERSITFAPSYSEENNEWTVLEEYDYEKMNYEEAGRQESLDKLDALYREKMEQYGINSNDLRLNWEEKNWKVKTEDVYTSKENNLSMVASIAECTNYAAGTIYYLYREDPSGSMNAYR